MTIKPNTNYSLDANNLTYLGERDFLLKVAENNGLRLFGQGLGTDSTGLGVHLDSMGRTAIGYGYDLLANATVAFSELTTAGATINTDAAGLQNAINGYIAGTTTLSQLRALISLPNEAVATKLLDIAADKRELLLNTFLTQNGILISNSREHAVLLSMWYQLPGAVGKGGYFINSVGGLSDMSKALIDGNRAEVWYQIRYGSANNGANGNGVVVRRYAESEVFGLYNDPANVPPDDAKQVYRMFTLHRSNISNYESKFGIAFDGTLGTILTKAVDGVMRPPLVEANLRYNLTGDNWVDAIHDELAPARNSLVADLNIGLNAVDYLPTDIYVDPGRASSKETIDPNHNAGLTGSDRNDILIGEGGDDVLTGGTGDDVLVGGTGDDKLYGGNGTDTYAFKTGDGQDSILDSDGLGKILENGTQLTGDKAKFQGNGVWLDESSNTKYQLDQLRNILTITSGSDTITINDFVNKEEGDGYLGIKLKNQITLSPDTAPAGTTTDQVTEVLQGALKTFTVAVASISDKAQTLILKADSAVASLLRLVTGAETLSFAGDGTIEITIPAGEDSVTLALLDTSGTASAEDAILTASFTDANGDLINSNTLTITYEQPGYNVGGSVPDSFTTDGCIMSGGNGNYTFNGSSINNLIHAGDGNNLIIGKGAPSTADPFSSTFNGDIFVAGYGNNQMYADEQVDIATALVQQKTLAPSGLFGDLFVTGYVDTPVPVHYGTGIELEYSYPIAHGTNTIVGGAGNDMIISADNNLVVMGPGNNTFIGGTTVVAGGYQTRDYWWTVHRNSVSVENNMPAYEIMMPDFTLQGSGGYTPSAQLLALQAYNQYNCNNNEISNDGWVAIPATDTHPALTVNSFSTNTSDPNPQYQPFGPYYDSYPSTPAGISSDTIFGGTGNNLIVGSNGGNYIDIGSGNSSIFAGGGDDTLFGSTGNSLINAQGGNDYIDCESGNHSVWGGAGDNTIYGGSGNQKIFAGIGAGNWADINGGNNYVDTGSGDTTVYGSGGNDTLISGSDAGSATHTTIYAGNGNEYIVGGSGDDVIVGGAGNDTICAGDGNTTIQLSSNAGENSTVYGGSGSDTIMGGAGNDLILAGDGGTENAATYVYAGSGTSVIYGGAGVSYLFGGSGSDTLYGGSGTDELHGGTGTSLFVAGSGNETIVGGSGSNTYEFDAGFGDIALIAQSSDMFKFGAGISASGLTVSAATGGNGGAALLIESADGGQIAIYGGLDGAISNFNFADGSALSLDQLLANSNCAESTIVDANGNSSVFGGNGNSTLAGGAGSNTFYVHGNDNTIVVSNSGDVVIAQPGAAGNTVMSGVNYVLPNNVQNLTLTGTTDLTSTGNNLDNVIKANDGNDTLDGGGGNDTLIGGTGQDTFCMDSTMGQDTVIDTSSQGAIIKLKPNIALGDLMATRQGDDLLLQLDASDSMLIQGYYANPQTTWSIQDANGNTTTPQAVLQTMAQLREVDKAEKLFINQCDASIKRSYLTNSKFTLQADGSLFISNAIAYSAFAYDSVKTTTSTTTQYSLNANGGISGAVTLPAVTHAPTDTWSLVPSIYSGVVGAAVAGESVSVKRVNMTSDAAVVYADTPYSSNLQSMGYQWFNISWTSTYESQTGPADDGLIRRYIFQNGYSSDQYATGLGALLGFQDTVYTSTTKLFSANGTPLGAPLASPGNLTTTGAYPQALLSAYSIYHYNYEIQKIDLSGTSGQTVYANAQTVVNSDAGNDIIYDAGFAYSGTGNDTMIGGGILMAGTGNNLLEYGNKMIAGVGDDTLIGGNTMIAGNGNDQIFAGSGAAIIQINPNIASNDLIGGTGDTTHFLDALYQSMGITDIQRRRDHGGMYAVDTDGDINYYNDDQLAAIKAQGGWLSDWITNNPDSLTYVQPLPGIVLPASNDFQALATYYAQGFLPQHTVAFGSGVTASDLHLTWGETIRSISGLPADPQMHYTTLNISWGTNNQSIQVMIPHTDDPLGSGTSQFTFANGTTLSMADMLAMAPAAPTFDPQIIHLNPGSGQQTIIENPSVSGDVIQFGAGITVGNAQFVLNGSDLLITYGTQGDSALVQGFAPNSATGNYSIGQFVFADGSAGAYTNDGQGNATLVAYDANGNLMGVFWQSADGSYGNDTSNADGSSTGIAHNPDGSYYTYANDGQGNSNELEYNTSGVKVGANWGKPGGTYGSEVFNADGSSSGTAYNADNSYNNYVNDGHGNITTIYFDLNSIETGYATATNDGLGNTTTTNYDVNDIKLSDSWVKADGSSGTDTFNANGTSSGTVINPAKGYSDTFTKTPLGSGRVETVINYTYTDGSTYTTDTVKATNGDYTQTWSRSDGSSGVTNHNAATGENTGTVNNPAKGFTEVFDNTVLSGGTTDAKITYTYTDGSTYTTDTVKATNGDYTQIWSRSDGSSGVTNHNAATGENTGTVNNPAKGFTEVFDNTVLINGSTESKITYTYTDGSTYTTDTVKASDGSYAQTWSRSDGSSGVTNHNALTGENTGTASYPAKGYTQIFDNTILAGGSTESKITYTYTDSSTYTTDTVKASNGDYAQTWSRSDGSSGVTNHNGLTEENTGTASCPAKGYTQIFDNTILTDGSTESKISYTYTDGSTYTTDTVKAANGDYAQTWSRSDGSSGVTNHNALTGENTGTASYPAKGYTQIFDNTILAGGSTESKITYTYTDSSTYTTDTVKATDGSYAQTWSRSDGSSGVTNHNALSGENTGTASYPAKGYTQVFDNTVLADGSTESKITYTYTNGSTYTTDTVKAADTSYTQVWSKSDGTSGTKVVDSPGVVVADSWVHADGSQGVNASGNHLVLGTAAVNSIKAVTGNEIMIGGLANDTFTTGAGTNLIAFNKGDGKDTVIDTAGVNNTISLGGNFAFADLALQKSGNNLILDIGATDSITLKNWYTGTKNIVDLQVIETAMSDFNHGSADVLRNSNVETFDFQQMVTAFDQARAANPGITMWGLTNALLTAHLSSSDTAALGGDLAYVYGSQGSLSGMNVSAAESTLSNSQFAAAPQTLNPWPTLNTGTTQIR